MHLRSYPTTPDHRAAVKATPVAKAMANKYYHSKIDVKVKDGKLLNIPPSSGN